MAAHSIWQGSIRFGLIGIPISLRTAVENHDLKFSPLDEHGQAPVGYRHDHNKIGKELKWEDIVKGDEYGDGKYVVLTPEDFRKANVNASQLLEIEDGVALDKVDPRSRDPPYYIVSTAAGAKSYELLREGLASKNKIGIGRVVMHTPARVACSAQGRRLPDGVGRAAEPERGGRADSTRSRSDTMRKCCRAIA